MNYSILFISMSLFCCLLGANVHAEEVSEGKNLNLPASLPTKKIVTATVPMTPHADADMVDPTLLNTYGAELYEIKKTEDAERAATLARETSGKIEADYQQQITLRKAKIEAFKARQEQINSEISAMRDEVTDYQKKFELVQGQYGEAEQRHEDFLANLEKEHATLDEMKSNYEAALTKLTERHERTKKSIAAAITQNHQTRSELASQSTAIQALESQVASLQADELKAKAEWMSLKSQIENQKGEKNRQFALLNETDKKYQSALAAQRSAQAELAIAQKNVAEYSKNIAENVRRLEASNMLAQKAKIIAEANKMKAEAEVEKLKNYVSMVKQSNKEMLSAQSDSEDRFMNAQLNLEAAKAELTINVASGEQFNLRKAKQESEQRSIASVESADAVLAGGKTWVIESACQIREHARSASPSLGEVTPGQRMPATAGPGKWVTVLSAGHQAYIKTDCGKFE